MFPAVGMVRRLAVAAVAALLSGCLAAGVHVADFSRPTVRVELEAAGMKNAQESFGAAFCRHYARLAGPDAPACDRWLLGVQAEPVHGASSAAALPPVAPAVVIIPGIFGECVRQSVTPFSHDYAYLRQLGYQVEVVPVSGRGSSELNARAIHDFFAARPPGKVIVIGYSKGITDFMVAATQARADAWIGRIAALVSVAGVVNGTPLASRGEKLYERIFREIPVPTCGPADGGGVASLGYRSATDTARAFARARHTYRTYSVAAVVDGGPVNPVLAMGYELLGGVDQRNDGQVLLDDAILPRSTFLGAFRADHWSIALPFEDSRDPWMAPLSIHNHFPRRALLAAILETLDRDLTGGQE